MAYATRTDIEKIYGKIAVARWADLDQDNDESFINDRIAYALSTAENYLNDRLRHSKYSIPFLSIPHTVNFLTALLAGIELYDSRLITSSPNNHVDEVSRQRKKAKMIIKQILSGQLSLNLDSVDDVIPTIAESCCESIDDICARRGWTQNGFKFGKL